MRSRALQAIDKSNLLHEIFKTFLQLALGRSLLFPLRTAPLVYILSWLHAPHVDVLQQNLPRHTRQRPSTAVYSRTQRRIDTGHSSNSGSSSPISILVRTSTINPRTVVVRTTGVRSSVEELRFRETICLREKHENMPFLSNSCRISAFRLKSTVSCPSVGHNFRM